MNKFRNIKIAVGIILLIVTGCKAQVLTQKSIEFDKLQKDNSFRIWFDVSDPISYVLTYNDEKLMLTFYTHKKRKNLLIRQDIQLSDSVNITYFKNLDIFSLTDCDSYQDYECFGLDGSTIRIDLMQDSRLNSYVYWSPEDQATTVLGRTLLNIQKKIEKDYNITILENDFYGALKKGAYWNHGEAVLTK